MGKELEAAEVEEVEGAEEPEVEASPIDELAQQMGWNPDFKGDGAVDAKTFILRSRDIQSSLGKTVNNLRRELDAVKEGVDVVRFTAEQSSKREISRLKGEIAQLKSKRREAIRDGDADAVERYDSEIDVLKDATKEPAASEKAPTKKGPPPEYHDWVEDNPWYIEDKEMQAYADALLVLPEYAAIGKVSYPRLLKKVEKAVKSEFTDKFPENKKKETTISAAEATSPAAPVTPSRQRAKPSKQKASAADLSYEQRSVGNDFVRQKIYDNLDQYAQALQDKYEGGTK